MLNKKPTKLFRKTLLASAVPLVAISMSGQANAQALEEVLVTATKRTESLQDVAIAVSAFTGNELGNLGIGSQREIALMTPNVTINVNANFVAPYIRGVGTQYANPGLEPSVATYFNDVYISRPFAGFMQFSDVARVEVLKGPQGTLYGRNTTGGAIRIITNDPTDEFEGRVRLGGGNYRAMLVDGFVSGPITDTLSGRISAQHEERDGWVDNIAGGEDMENRDISLFHGKLLWQPSDRLSIKLDGDYTEKEDREGITFQSLFDGLPEQTGVALGGIVSKGHDEYSGEIQFDDNGELSSTFEGYGGQLRIDYEFNNFTLSSISGVRHMKFEGVADLDATSADLLIGNTLYDETNAFSQEFQLVSTGDGPWNWMAGLYYYKEDGDDNFGTAGQLLGLDPSLFPGAFTGGDGDIEVESFAPYGNVSYDITDQWEILVGLRYTDESKDVSNNFYISSTDKYYRPIKPYMQVIPVDDEKFDYDDWTPRAQVTWRPDDGLMFYASYSEGIKSGGFNMPSPSPAPLSAVDNETITSYEIGWKTQFERLRFNGAIFHYDLEDLQVQVTDLSGGITSVRNAGDGTVDGIEADLTFAATDNLVLGAGFGWQEAEFESVPGGNYNPPCAAAPQDPQCIALNGFGLATVVGDLKGNNLPHSPELTGYLRSTYSWSLGDSGNMAFNVLASYNDGFSYTPDNLYEEDSYWLVNTSLTWSSASDAYEINAFINNLTDEEYNTHKAPLSATGGWKVPGPPLMYGVRLAYNF